MRKIIIAALALLALSTTARADEYRYNSNGDRYVSHCSHSGYGWSCWGAWNPEGITARVLHVPADMPRNTDPNWARGCRSCVDLSGENRRAVID